MSTSIDRAAGEAPSSDKLRIANQPWQSAVAELDNHPITFQIADTDDLRRQAYRLIYHVYLDCGYLRPNPSEMRITPYDSLPDTVTFVAVLRDTVIATVTLVPDGPLGLPMDEIYRPEVAVLRAQDRPVAEATGLADRRRNPVRGLPVFLRLSRLMVHHARDLGVADLLITANPRHERFYRECLQFEPFGPPRSYPSVENHPALAFRLNLLEVERQRVTNPRAYARYFDDPAGAVIQTTRRDARRHRPAQQAAQASDTVLCAASEAAGHTIVLSSAEDLGMSMP